MSALGMSKDELLILTGLTHDDYVNAKHNLNSIERLTFDNLLDDLLENSIKKKEIAVNNAKQFLTIKSKV